jgi:hypothetical protein
VTCSRAGAVARLIDVTGPGRGFHEWPHEWHQHSPYGGGILGSERCAYQAGMQCVGGDGGGLQPAGQPVGVFGGQQLGPWNGFAVLCGPAAVLTGLAAWRLRRRSGRPASGPPEGQALTACTPSSYLLLEINF